MIWVKKLPTCKPDPVPALRRAIIIYLAPALLPGSSCLPSGIGRAALDRRYTWHFSMQGLPAPAVTCRRRGLLPHVFNLTPLFAFMHGDKKGGSYFLWHYLLAETATRRLTGALPCAVRTFLPSPAGRAMTRLVAPAKVSYFLYSKNISVAP